MNTILLKTSEISDNNTVVLSGRRCKHILSVIQPKIGDSLCIGVIGENLGTAIVKEFSPKSITLMITDLPTPPPKTLPVCLICALPRPKMFRRILHMAVVSGVKELYFINTKRVEQSFWSSSLISESSCNKIIEEALSQTGDTILPHIHFHHRFDPFVECYIPPIIKEFSPVLFHPTGDKSYMPQKGRKYALFIGPEGGFIDYEVDTLTSAGCVLMSMGPRILQVEQAVSAIVGHTLLSII